MRQAFHRTALLATFALGLPTLAQAAVQYYKWTPVTLPVASGASCGNGTPARVFVNRTPMTTKTLVYFEGGGACWNQNSCLGKGKLTEVATDTQNIDLTSDGDDIKLLQITRGWLSQGITHALTAFGGEWSAYDVVGHLHTKKSLELNDSAFSFRWNAFLMDNLLGRQRRMADAIVARYVTDTDTGGWLNAQEAVYVTGSSAMGPMRAGNLPAFAHAEAAQEFVQQRGGRAVPFGAIDVALLRRLAPNLRADHRLHSD